MERGGEVYYFNVNISGQQSPNFFRGRCGWMRRLFLFLLAVLTMVLAGCGGTGVDPNSYQNPLVSGLADPCVIAYNGTYYMSGTGDNLSYDIYTSADLVHWTKGAKIFSPAGQINVWAPDFFYNQDDGKFYLYYTVNHQVGVACSNTPDGPYTDLGVFVSDAIDADMFRDDDGSCYLYYSQECAVYVQPMTNPTTPKGAPQKLLQPDQGWDNPCNEAPWMVKYNSTYYLIYSGNSANLSSYAEGFATSSGPVGPFTKYGGNPIVKATATVFGPGSGCVVVDHAGVYWHIYHQKDSTVDGWARSVCMDKLWFDNSGVIHCQVTRNTSNPKPATQ